MTECRTAPATTVADIIARVGGILNDREAGYEHIQWPVGELVGHINEALCELSAHRPDAFVEQVEMTLKPGRRQEAPKGYSAILSLDYNIPPNGSLDGPEAGGKISETSVEFAAAFSLGASCFSSSGPSCGDPSPHGGTNSSAVSEPAKITGYERNKLDQSVVYVQPPVPRGKVVKVAATLQKLPCKHSADHLKAPLGLSCKYDSAVVDWVLMRCFEKDIESEFARQAAERHRTHFYQALGAKYTMESQFGSQFWEGRTPDGEPNPYHARRTTA